MHIQRILERDMKRARRDMEFAPQQERRKIRTDIADEIEEMLMNPNLLEDALAEISVLEQEDTE